MIQFRTAVMPQLLGLVLTVVVASACSGPTPADRAATGTASTSEVATDDSNEGAGEFGSGTLTFNLQSNAPLTLPVTFCAGHGTILTIGASEGEAQVDVRVPELPGNRDRASMIERAEAGYRFNGTDQGRTFMEIWQSRSIEDVVRDGDHTRVSGTMYGLRSYDNGDGTGSTPEPVDGEGDREFNIDVTCSA